ncbi:LysM domain-containing protein [Tamilnaduibacter salinus]|uniref:LysM domain-containing protein n=1 Tax=Tamilnaduibacter salinus TaxID=1484056 RepID=A0A2U1CW64_9GAMM|nr:LysM domain-containing protein [Tamilnaduibacter salinus]PVY76002.1 LysM domain-containing protein [Tamilnaduibacter salinus]
MTAAYTVKAGDTLSGIASKHDSTVSRLMDLNPAIEDPDRIYAGQDLTLPSTAENDFSSTSPDSVQDEAPCADEFVEIVHVTGTESFYFLTQEDLEAVVEEERRVGRAIEALYQTLDTEEEAGSGGSDELPSESEGAVTSAIQEKKQATVAELQDLDVIGTSMQTTPNLTEIKRLKGNKHYTYVRSDKIANHWRRYDMTAKDRDRSAGWLSRDGIDTDKLREAVEMDFGIRFQNSFWKMDPESNFGQSMNRFHEEVSWSYWGDDEQRQNRRDETGFDASAEAQFMRFASGASALANFDPSEGKVHLQARVDAQYSLAQGKTTVEQAYPANNESEIRIYYRIGGWEGERAYETLGHFQARLTITASGYAGASAMLAANVKVDCSEGVPSLKGITADRSDNQGVDAEGGVFAGVRAGCEVLGGLYWDDKLTHPSDWKTLCKIGEKVEGAAGIGAEAYLKLGFNDRSGKFILRAHAGLVLGLGASGTFVLEVNANDLASMMRFVYNALLKVDIRYLEVFDEDTGAFGQYVETALFALSTGLDFAGAASEYASSGVKTVESFVIDFIRRQKEGWAQERESVTLAENLVEDIAKGEDSVFRHSPPEVKGPVLHKLTYDYSWTPQLVDGTFIKVKAIGDILKSFQGWRDFEESMLRMNPEGRVEPNTVEVHALKLFRFIGKNAQDYRLFRHYLKGKVAIADRPVILDPFRACRYCGIT